MASPVTPTSAFAMYSTKRKSTSPGTPNMSKKKKSPFIKDQTSKSSLSKVEQLPPSRSKICYPSVVLNRLDSTNGINQNGKQKVVQSKVKTENNKEKLQDTTGRKLSQRTKQKLFEKTNTMNTTKVIRNDEKKKSKLRVVLKTGKNLKQFRKIERKVVKAAHLSSTSLSAEEEDQFTNEINPIEEASNIFQWLIHPLPIDNFFNNNWEKTPVHIKRNKESYYRLLMSTPKIDDILRRHNILYTKNIDITSYSNGQRETHNPQGRALPSVVWDYYSNGCSVRMLNPQTYISKIHTLNATLQEFFGCFVGANFYLTPPGSQGFAPHYDDIEAFILQIEGKKRWRLYKPRDKSEYLPRYSSDNFKSSEIGEPIFDAVLNAGDLLYFPRGTIHQGETYDDSHSLHLTLSVYQKNSWGDYLEKLLPAALTSAIAENSELREGLPLNYLNKIGFVNKNNNTHDGFRQKFIEKTKELLHKVIDNIDVDAAADQMAKSHMHDYLPPVLVPVELECSVLEDGEKMGAGGQVENRVEIEPDTRIRLARSHAVRLVEEDDTCRLYYSTDNSKEYHEYDVQFLEAGKELAPAVAKIISVYPEYIKVDELPIEGEDNKVQVARDLWEKSIILTDVPLPILD